MEDQRKSEIDFKIKSGLYRLLINQDNLENYAMITKQDGSIVKGYVCCINCIEIFNNDGKSLSNHKCFLGPCLKKLNTDEIDKLQHNSHELDNEEFLLTKLTPKREQMEDIGNYNTIWETFNPTLMNDGNNELENKAIDETGTNRSKDKQTFAAITEDSSLLEGCSDKTIWQNFLLTDDGSFVNGSVSCRQCNMVFNYEISSTQRQVHNCLAAKKGENIKMLPTLRDIEDMMKLEIYNRITIGVFKLKKINETAAKTSSLLWEVFASILKADGSILDEYLCCTKCQAVLKTKTKFSAHLYEHACYKRLVGGKSKNSLVPPPAKVSMKEIQSKKLAIQKKLTQGEYKLTMRKNDASFKWKILAMITKKQDGTHLKDYVYCTQCKTVLKHNTRRACPHKCTMNPDNLLQEYIKRIQEVGEGGYNSKRLRVEKREDDSATTSADEDEFEVEQSKSKRARLNNDNNNGRLLVETRSKSNEALNDYIWSKFEQIIMKDGSTLKGVISCRKCRMVLQYDGSTKIHLEDHKCFSMASWPATMIGNENNSETKNLEKSSTNFRGKNINGCHSICLRKEFQNSKFHIPVKSGQTSSRETKKSAASSGKKVENPKHINAFNQTQTTTKVKDSSHNSNSFTEKDKKEPNNIVVQSRTNEVFTTLSKLEESYCRELACEWMERGVHCIELVDLKDSAKDSLNVFAENKKNEIKTQLQEISNPKSISIDFWRDDIFKKHFFRATLHFNKTNELCHIPLGVKSLDFPPQQSSEHSLRNKLENLLKELGIEEINNIIFVTAIDHQQLAKDLDNLTHLKCSRYLFEKVLESAMQSPELQDIIKNCKLIVEQLKNSNEENFKEINTEIDSISYYSIFKIITNNWLKVKDMLIDKKELEATISQLQNLIKLCKSFELIFKRLEEKQTPSLCFVIPSIERLKAIGDSNSQDNPQLKAFKANLLKNIQEIWLTNISIWHKAACFLYPPANQQQENDLAEIKQFCITKIKESKGYPETEDMDCLTEETDDISFFFPNLVKGINEQTTNSLKEEIKRYSLERIVIDKSFNSLQWWQSNSNKYPLLSPLALQILCIPASTKNSQKVLPLPKNVRKENLSLLSPKVMENLLFLNSFT